MTAADTASPNTDQSAYWNHSAGPVWVAMQDALDNQLEALGVTALAALAPKPGERVIDIGCGCGATSLELARRVGSGGSVLGVDISAPMLEVARQRAMAQALTQASFTVADAQVEALPSADAAFSRFGVMFFADPVAAFANIRKALTPSGRLAFVCWQAMVDNPWMTTPMAAAASLLPAPPPPPTPGAPGPFAFADRDRLRGILSEAGFAQLSIEPNAQPIVWPSLDDGVRLAMTVGPLGAAVREYPQLREAIAGAVRAGLEPYVDASEVRLPSATWIVRASAA